MATKKVRKPSKKDVATITEVAPDKDYNLNILGFMQVITPPTPADIKNVPKMRGRYNWYLQKCREYNVKITNFGAYLAIGITKEQAKQLAVSDDEDVRTFMQSVNSQCAFYREMLMYDGKVNSSVGIFQQKNFDNMKDFQETVVTQNVSIFNEGMDVLQKRYLESVYTSNEQAKTMLDNHALSKEDNKAFVFDAEVVQKKETVPVEVVDQEQTKLKEQPLPIEKTNIENVGKDVAPSGEF